MGGPCLGRIDYKLTHDRLSVHLDGVGAPGVLSLPEQNMQRPWTLPLEERPGGSALWCI